MHLGVYLLQFLDFFVFLFDSFIQRANGWHETFRVLVFGFNVTLKSRNLILQHLIFIFCWRVIVQRFLQFRPQVINFLCLLIKHIHSLIKQVELGLQHGILCLELLYLVTIFSVLGHRSLLVSAQALQIDLWCLSIGIWACYGISLYWRLIIISVRF